MPDRAVALAFGQRLRRLRREHGASQDDLMQRTGIHRTAIGRFERGLSEPRLTTLLWLAAGVGVPPRDLVEELIPLPELRMED